MNTYKVTITETLKKEVIVEAEDECAALQKVSDDWYKGEHILDADNFVGVDYDWEEIEHNKNKKAPSRDEGR